MEMTESSVSHTVGTVNAKTPDENKPAMFNEQKDLCGGGGAVSKGKVEVGELKEGG